MRCDGLSLGKVAVLYGGNSSERAVSLNGGSTVCQGLKEAGVDAHLVDAQDMQTVLSLREIGFSRAFIMLHGKGGEDGQIQGILEWIGIPYTGSGILASALAMNKLLSKQIWRANQLPVLPDCLLDKNSTYAQLCTQLQTTVLAIKPVSEGSSIGVYRVSNEQEFSEAVSCHCNYQLMAEAWVTGRELTYGIVGETVLPGIEIVAGQAHTFYDYDAKYLANDTQYLCPAPLTDALNAQLCHLSKQAFEAIGARGWGRVDFMLDAQNNPWILEINLVPGMTDHSLVPQAAAQMGVSFSELVLQILCQTMPEGQCK